MLTFQTFYKVLSVSHVDGVASNQHADNNKRLVKYCLYAWLAPALVVSLTVLIDRRLNEGYFGYGK